MEETVITPVKRSFLKEECIFDVVARTPHAKLYAAYQDWCRANDILCTITSKKFSINLKTNPKLERVRGSQGQVVWVGIRLKSDKPDDREM